jgi:hypothetical protein
MPGKAHKRPVSQKQARFFGARAGEGKAWAKADLKGVKVSKLPKRAKRKK